MVLHSTVEDKIAIDVYRNEWGPDKLSKPSSVERLLRTLSHQPPNLLLVCCHIFADLDSSIEVRWTVGVGYFGREKGDNADELQWSCDISFTNKT
jgi:hypothetical protein